MKPPSDYVTKADLKAAMDVNKADLKAAMDVNKADLKAAMEANKADLKAAMEASKADFNAALSATKAELKAAMDDLCTRIYRYMVPREEFEEFKKDYVEFKDLSLNSFDRIFSLLEDMRADNAAHFACYKRLESDVAANTKDIALIKTKLAIC